MVDEMLADLFGRIGDKISSKAVEHKLHAKKLEEEGNTGWATHEYMLASVILEIASVFSGLAVEELGGVST